MPAMPPISRMIGAKRRNRDRLRRVVVCVDAQLGLDVGVDGRLLRRREHVVLEAEPLDCDELAQGDGLALRPVGRPGGGDVAAVTPHGAELLAAPAAAGQRIVVPAAAMPPGWRVSESSCRRRRRRPAR